jgi:hypothetical protein
VRALDVGAELRPHPQTSGGDVTAAAHRPHPEYWRNVEVAGGVPDARRSRSVSDAWAFPTSRCACR